MIWNLSEYINLLVLTVVLAILAIPVVILKLRLRNISKKIACLISTATCLALYNSPCFRIIDKANASVFPCSFLSFFFFFFSFLFHLLLSLSLTLIIGIFYSLNYTSPLPHLIATFTVSHLCLSSIVCIISTLFISIFSCLNFT